MAALQVGSVPAPASISYRGEPFRGTGRADKTRRHILALLALALFFAAPNPARAAGPEGQLTWGVHVSLAPIWFDPAETQAMITPFMVMYALHDAMVKPMPGNPATPSLAESWTMSPDGLIYEFVLRKGVTFHNGEPVTAEDVKFSFERYRGTSAKQIKDRVAAIETPDPQKVRFKLKEPWPDFLTFYASATGAGWVVPKKYVEQVGDEGFKKAPIGAGPYKFVAFTPGLELTFEAYEQYWRKTPSVKRLVFKVIPDESTRLAALKRGEIDIAYSIRGELAEELQRTKGLTLKPAVISGPFWIYFPDQWDPKSPWADPRVRLAASLAIDRKTINQALTLGHSRLTGSILRDGFVYFWQPPAPVYDPAKAKQLLAEAGHPKGFDAGDYYCDSSYANLGEAVLNDLQAVGIRAKLRPLERAAFFKGYSEKTYKNIIQGASGAFGNTATRFEAFVMKGGAYVYGSYPEIDALFQQQAVELDVKKREAILHKMQQLVHERTIYAPIWQLAFVNGAGPRVGESGLGLIAGHAYSAPYEDVTLAGK
jgi:peptide/nickel transport system substrate-binding protein